MAKSSTIYTCQKCGAQTSKWAGRCFECGAWNTLVEETISKEEKKVSAKSGQVEARTTALLDFLAPTEARGMRVMTGWTELDRVLGGGFVHGSLLLFGGEPGIGKSTILLQIICQLSSQGQKCLYVSGEESGPQVASRAQRLGLHQIGDLKFLSTNNLEEVLAAVDNQQPNFLVLDSVQTIQSESLESAAGTVSQVRDVTHKMMEVAKKRGTTVLLVGHVTKEGSIAGPRLLEHMVDAVFYFELSTSGGYRLLRAQKNRFGATHELAVFEMTSVGLKEVKNPSERFLAERSLGTPGSAVVAHMEGSRSFLTEVQALVQKCYQGYPRRTVQGVDQNRISLLLAVIERSLGVSFSERDVYCKVASGDRADEPAADLALLFVLVSAALNRPLPEDILLVGEVGLGGEVRSVSSIQARLSEGKTVGIKRAIIPEWTVREAAELKGVKAYGIKNVRDVMRILEWTTKELN